MNQGGVIVVQLNFCLTVTILSPSVGNVCNSFVYFLNDVLSGSPYRVSSNIVICINHT